MNSCHLHVGRLLEIRADSGFRTAEEVDQVFQLIGRELDRIPEPLRSVNVVDWRRCPVMTAPAADRLLELIIPYNPRVERSATIASRESPTAMMQFVRVLRETEHPDRRLFHDVEELEAWLDEVLTREESLRLRAFLADDSSHLFSSTPPENRRRR